MTLKNTAGKGWEQEQSLLPYRLRDPRQREWEGGSHLPGSQEMEALEMRDEEGRPKRE